ncbi:MAG: glycosyltransferase family 2 protein [Chthoniobacterales bacterium]
MTDSEHSFLLTILMPCLNEAETLGACIRKAQASIAKLAQPCEVLIADNGSSDRSIEIAQELGARVIHVQEKGYGNALRTGIAAARGKWILMGDADDSYDFSAIEPFMEKLREGYEFVIGCRMPAGGGKILAGAMPWKHRWIGNPILSFLGRMFFHSDVHDFHCGLRALSRDAWNRIDLRTSGMEFASEMVIKAKFRSLRITEVPITLYPDGRSRRPHLRSWRDGWRHLRFMLLFSPRWLFLIPGLVLFLTGVALTLILSLRGVTLGGAVLDAGSLSVAAMLWLAGAQLVAFAVFTKIFSIAEGLLPADPKFTKLFRFMTLERGVLLGILTLFAGVLILLRAWLIWRSVGYGTLSYSDNLRRVIPAGTAIVFGIQIIFSSFFASVLGLRLEGRTPPHIESER